MATKKVNIDIVAKDKTRQAMQSATKGVDNLKNSVFNLRNALVGLGVGVAVKSFIDVGKSVESLQVRLKFLFGSAKEGAKAFDVMSKFAGRVPFSLDQIQQASGNLAVVSKDADELNKMLEITGNVASVTGLDFRTTAEQIQRSFSAGVASADIFRERGVRDLLGFKAGATVPAKETAEAFERVFGKGGRFGNATDEFAQTFVGTMSMIGDSIFNFKKVVAESLMGALKKEFGALDVALKNNQDVIENIATALGKGLASAVTMVSKGVKLLHDNFDSIKRLGMSLVIFGVAQAFLKLAFAIGKARLGLLAFTRLSKTTVVGILFALGITAMEATGKLEKLFELFEKPKSIEDFSAEVEILTAQLSTFANTGMQGFKGTKREADKTLEGMTKLLTKMKEETGGTNAEIEKLTGLISILSDAIESVPEDLGTTAVTASAEKMNVLTKAFHSFKDGFMEAVEEQKSGFAQIEAIGKETFGKLKSAFADFIMTGKANFGDLARFVVRSFLEMLIGQAVQFAFKKSLALFKMDAIKKALISAYQSVVTTLASIPFPFNIALAGGALAFAMGFVNKIKGFEKGGRPPVGRPSIVGEKGAELFVPDQAGTIVPNDKLGMGKPVTVNFNINTVDATGFEELLVNSRGVLINLINSAVNEKGQRAII